MLYEIAEAVPHPDHTVTVTWADGARGVRSSNCLPRALSICSLRRYRSR